MVILMSAVLLRWEVQSEETASQGRTLEKLPDFEPNVAAA